MTIKQRIADGKLRSFVREKRLSRAELKVRLYRQRYLVPNLVTLGSMFCGFLTIIYASSNRFEKAAIAIGLAILLDGLDGRVARRLNATSKFGGEFDSFADLVSFGVAPGMLVYNWCFKVGADEWGVFVTFIYALCAASRLARFNIAAENLKSFVGLPTPGAAAVVAAMVNIAPTPREPGIALFSFGTLVMLSLAFLMVSKFDFFSIKMLKVNRMRAYTKVAIGALIALTWYNTEIGFALLASSYALSGPFRFIAKRNAPSGEIDETKKSQIVKMKAQ